jgi:hypothetical protein
MTEELLKMDGFNDAIIGEAQRFNSHFVVYDYDKVIMILMRDGMNREEAREYWQFNQAGAWVGEGTPAFLFKKEEQNERV